MKQYFPFTDYDFYAYITSGMLLIASLDYAYGGGALVHRSEWTVVQISFWVAIAYLLGQIIAGPSSAILEHWIARTFLHSPLSIALGLAEPRWRELVARRLFANREYAALPEQTRSRILTAAAAAYGRPVAEITDPETVFGLAFGVARSIPDTAARLDQFRNLYGFSRNVSFSSLVGCVVLSVRYRHLPEDLDKNFLIVGAIVLFVGMFGRFLKFYASYSREVLGAYNSKLSSKAET